jgi:hypothetical protein
MKTMRPPKLWKKLKRHPISAGYDPLTTQEHKLLAESLKDNGYLPTFPIVIHDGKVLDGWHRLEICKSLGIVPVFVQFKEVKARDAEDYAFSANIPGRRSTLDQIQAQVDKRRKRIFESRTQGKSIRAIAEEEGVSKATVQKDLQSPGVQGCTPETPNSKQKTDAEAPKVGKTAPPAVTGKDGKTYSATKPPKVCDRCKRNGGTNDCQACKDLAASTHRTVIKNGEVAFSWSDFYSAFEKVAKSIDRFAEAHGRGDETPKSEGVRRLLGEWLKGFQEWAKDVSGKTVPTK